MRRQRSTARRGSPAFVEDEAGVQISQNPSYGWRPTNGRDTVPIGFSKKSVRLIGIMGEDVLYVPHSGVHKL